MKAICLEDYGKAAVIDVPEPKMKPLHAKIRVKATSICGSDVSAYLKKGVPVKCPIILGHEVAGTIEEIEPDNEKGLKPGDSVILDPYMACGKCYPCSLGKTNACETLQVLGVQTNGAMSEFFVHPVSHLNKLPGDMPWDIAPLAEPLTIALHAIHRTQLKEGEHAVIIGAGAIGILAALAAENAYGAIPVIMDIVDSRLELARSLGVPHTVNSAKENATQRIADITNGRMAEVVIEMSGAPAVIAQTPEYASYAGRIAFTGWPSADTKTPMSTFLFTKKELCLLGSRTSAGEFPEAIELIDKGVVDVRKILTDVIPFDAIPGALEGLATHPDKYLKISSLL